jgi:plasmid stabilization system protein ParE
MTYEPLLVPGAEADVERIIAYLTQRSPQGAAAWCERWEEAMAELLRNPLQFALAPESLNTAAMCDSYFSKPVEVEYTA